MKPIVLFSIVVICLFFFYPKLLLAQPPGFENDTNDVPIDGGLSILLAAGIGYGIKRNFKQNKMVPKNKPAPKN